jgi:hypothetical protein
MVFPRPFLKVIPVTSLCRPIARAFSQFHSRLFRLLVIAFGRIYVVSGCLTLIGIFAMRWNVALGGQLFSKSFLGYTTYKMRLITREGLLMAVVLSLLPLLLLWVLVKLLPSWHVKHDALPAVR